MSDYTVNLTPSLVNLASEGSLDTSVVNGVSLQRTLNATMVKTNSGMKLIGHVLDGGTFNDNIATIGNYPNINGNPGDITNVL